MKVAIHSVSTHIRYSVDQANSVQRPLDSRYSETACKASAAVHISQIVIDLGSSAAEPYLRQGWSAREYGFTWAVDALSTVEFPSIWCDDDAIFGIEIEPAIHAGVCPTQKLNIFVNGTMVAALEFSEQKRKHLQIMVPRDVVRAREFVRLDFEHPNCIKPSDIDALCLDSRRLSFMFFEIRFQSLDVEKRKLHQGLQTSKQTPLAFSSSASQLSDLPNDALLKFESLGLNCEFGFVQRHFGIEPISLLRFAGMPYRKLIYGLQQKFCDLATADNLSMFVPADNPSQGYIGVEKAYQMMYHTKIKSEDTQSTLLIEKETRRIQFLARKLIEDVESSNKIFVIRAEDLTDSQVLDLYQIVRQNDKGWLLWVVLDIDGSRVGRVELLMPGLMRGYMDRFASLELGLAEISYQSWGCLLVNAYALWVANN